MLMKDGASVPFEIGYVEGRRVILCEWSCIHVHVYDHVVSYYRNLECPLGEYEDSLEIEILLRMVS